MQTKLIRFATAAIAALGLAACGQTTPASSDVKFDSAHSVGVDVVIPEGRIVAVSNDTAAIDAAVREQLYYTVGQLNGLNGGAPDMRRTEVTQDTPVARADGLFDVKYAAKLLVAWPRERQIPATYTFVLPARGDWTGLSGFFTQFGADEHGAKLCLAPEAHEVAQSVLWYHYRPLKSSCPLRNPANDNADVVARVTANLTVSAENTENKAPEYGKVWEDGRLVVTAIFGKNEAGQVSPSDAGISAYSSLYRDLITRFGTPTTSDLAQGQGPGAANAAIHMTWTTADGEVDAQLFLVDGIRSVDQNFMNAYNARTRISDFISYSGHSGLGANIRALARMGQFEPRQYQIFLVNGCDTFAYVDYALRDAHAVANPGFGPDKYFDIITNAMPSYFHMNSTSNMAVVNALVGKTQTYRQLLAGFDRSQRANVTGEQDNTWPAAFGD